ncbi:hypothetical protein [Amycolatopsis sp. NPDC004169]|uniref:hypothetical protein n=1 Tax=Amycolatopsis sp. NPDC004169 TaxID=3154453 RepID=UPI0033B814B2
MTKRESEDKASLDPSATNSCEGPAQQGDQSAGQPFTLNKMYGQFTTAIQVGTISGDLNVTTTPDPQDGLLDHIVLPVKTFLIEFELYLERVGNMQAQLALIPQGMWPVIDAIAYQHTDILLEGTDLQHIQSLPDNMNLREAIAFLSKVAWERGYFMAHFHRQQRIPRPIRPVDPLAIMDKIIAEGDPENPSYSLGNAIEVPLQRAVSMCTELEPVARTLRMIGDDLYAIVQPHLQLWCDTARSLHGYGILAARAEVAINANPPKA